MTSQKAKILQGIDTILIRVSDIHLSKKWYEEKLDLNPVWNDEQARLIVFDTGGPTSITLWQTDKKIEIDQASAAYPIFKTLDALQARQVLTKKGVQTGELVEDEFVKFFVLNDPDGNIIEVCEVLA